MSFAKHLVATIAAMMIIFASVILLGSMLVSKDDIEHLNTGLSILSAQAVTREVRLAKTDILDDETIWKDLLSCFHPKIADFERSLRTGESFDARQVGNGNDFDVSVARSVLWKMPSKRWSIFPKNKNDDGLVDKVVRTVTDALEKSIHEQLEESDLKSGIFHSRIRVEIYHDVDEDGDPVENQSAHMVAFLESDTSPLFFMNRTCSESRIKKFMKKSKRSW